MKNYSDSAVSKADIDAIDAKQAEQIKGLKFWVGLLGCGVAINFALIAGMAFYIVR